jgi:hypothetical protein
MRIRRWLRSLMLRRCVSGLMLVVAAAGLTPTPLGAREPGKKYGAEGCGHPVVLPVSANFRLL